MIRQTNYHSKILKCIDCHKKFEYFYRAYREKKRRCYPCQDLDTYEKKKQKLLNKKSR